MLFSKVNRQLRWFCKHTTILLYLQNDRELCKITDFACDGVFQRSTHLKLDAPVAGVSGCCALFSWFFVFVSSRALSFPWVWTPAPGSTLFSWWLTVLSTSPHSIEVSVGCPFVRVDHWTLSYFRHDYCLLRAALFRFSTTKRLTSLSCFSSNTHRPSMQWLGTEFCVKRGVRLTPWFCVNATGVRVIRSTHSKSNRPSKSTQPTGLFRHGN